MFEAIGVDGARGGWAMACLAADGSTRLALAADIAEVARRRGRATVAIDVPIGLPDSVDFRPCDAEARTLLGRRASCVFTPPARYLLPAAGDYGAMRALVADRRRHDPAAKGLSAQAAGIARKVAEVDRFARERPCSEAWLFECHPELSFRALGGGAPLAPKRSPAGRAHRSALVGQAFPDALERLAAAGWPIRDVAPADLLDAYAALTTAVRCARGEHRELGGGERDAAGVLMRMAI